MGSGPSTDPTDVPAGLIAVVVEILRAQPGPMKRRALLEELDRRGHRVSLAGLNRTLEHCRRQALTVEAPNGVRLGVRGGPPTR